MRRALSPLSRCAEICGLKATEIILGAKPGPQHRRLVARYRSFVVGGRPYLYARIVADIRAALEICAMQQAADLFVVLRLLVGSSEQRFARRAAPRRPKRRPGNRGGRIGVDRALDPQTNKDPAAQLHSLAVSRGGVEED